jgi:hypothetical protein
MSTWKSNFRPVWEMQTIPTVLVGGQSGKLLKIGAGAKEPS